MHFENGILVPWIVAGIALCLAWLLVLARQRARFLQRFGIQGNRRRFRVSIAFSASALAITLLLIALTGPTWGRAPRMVYLEGDSIFFAVDVSLSMTARDVQPDRLKAACFLAQNVMKETSPARFGLIAFAGTSMVLAPLTSDSQHVQGLLGRLAPSSVSTAGTRFNPLQQLLRRISSAPEDGRRTTLIVFTDGEFFDDVPASAFAEFSRSRVRLVLVGLGTPEGAPILESDGDNQSTVKDDQGETVITRLREDKLASLAQGAGGEYLKFASVGETTTEIMNRFFRERNPNGFSYQNFPVVRTNWFVWAAWIVLAGSLILVSGKPVPRLKRLLAVFGLLFLAGCSLPGDRENREGIRLIQKKEYPGGIDSFSRSLRLQEAGSVPQALVGANLSDALLRAGKSGESASASLSTLKACRKLSGNGRENLLYNLGCAQLAMGNRKLAAESFRLAMETGSFADDASWNLEVALRDRPTPPPPPSPPPPPPPEGTGGDGAPPPAAGTSSADAGTARQMLDSLRGRENPPPQAPNPNPSVKNTGPYW